MALSNIGNEPRREITESVIGIAAVVLYIAADYLTVTLVFGLTDPLLIVAGSLGFFIVTIGVIPLLLLFTHAIGEEICDLLGRADPRPRQRYRGQ